MTPSSRKLILTLIRLAKGMLKACEMWVWDQEPSAGSPTGETIGVESPKSNHIASGGN